MMFNYFAKPDPSKEVIKFPRGRIDDQLEAYVTRLLEEAGIACFIWGEQYLSIMGSTTGGFLSGYVVPDKDIERAAEILDTADFPPCIQGRGAYHAMGGRIRGRGYTQSRWPSLRDI
ncbi:hypothetical protein BDW69DRAFT_190195 [Aspergillus filifer]